jgi:8-oxo-dGTP pyrophosphatase MutT (NUDIX family)
MLSSYEFENYSGAGLILFTFDMKFLLVRERKSSKWGICKGHRERKDNNDPIMTAKREAYEELGLTDSDYDLEGSPFVLPSSPKIYIFQYARLKIDIMTKFAEKQSLSNTFNTSRKFMEITDIYLMPYDELIQDLNNYNNNVYLRLLQACLSGTFVPPHGSRGSIESKKKAFVKSTFSGFDDARSSGSDESLLRTPPTPQKKFYNSMIPGGSPIYMVGPERSPLLVSEPLGHDMPALKLEVVNEEEEISKPKPNFRERTSSGTSLLEALRGSPSIDRCTASPIVAYPPISPTVNYGGFTGGGAGGLTLLISERRGGSQASTAGSQRAGSISPSLDRMRSSPSVRMCSSYILPHSPSPGLSSTV